MRKPKKETIRRKADDLLMDYIRAKHKGELCYVCRDEPIVCGHHFVSKKNSMALRYYLPNIIPIGVKCHNLVHCQPHLVEPKICFDMGKAWYEDLMEVKRQGVKFNLEWITIQYNMIRELLEDRC